jgi:cathepsin B
MKAEISTYGPMYANHEVYPDFPCYGSGVYKHVYGDKISDHAVKVIGWGSTDEGQDYWIIANSFGPNWGENGFFRIAPLEVGVDDEMFACTPDTSLISDNYSFLY